jgi:hypothetical protein
MLGSELPENGLYIVLGRLFGYFFPQKSDKRKPTKNICLLKKP